MFIFLRFSTSCLTATEANGFYLPGVRQHSAVAVFNYQSGTWRLHPDLSNYTKDLKMVRTIFTIYHTHAVKSMVPVHGIRMGTLVEWNGTGMTCSSVWAYTLQTACTSPQGGDGVKQL